MKRTSKRIIAITLAMVITISLMVTGLSAVSAAVRVPYAPTGVFTQNSGTGFNITWRAAANATGYKVYYKTAESDWEFKETNTNSVNLEDLEYGTLYYIQVQSIGANGVNGGFAKVSSMTHVRPTRLISTAYNTNASITVGWEPADGANGYAIAKYHEGKFVNYFYTADTTYTDTTTVAGTRYAYQIKPYFSNGKSAAYGPWSNIKTLTTLYRPTVDENTVFSTVENMNINWNYIQGVTNYRLAFMREGDTAWNFRTTSKTYYNIPYPTQGAKYFIQVQPTNAKFSGQWSVVYTHHIEPLGVPAITGIETTYDKITFNWDAVKEAKVYDIAFRRTVDDEGVWHHKSTSDTSISVNNPTPETTYTVKVRALCGKVAGEYSETSDSDIPVLGVPTITGINSTYEKMTVNWSKVDDATGYEIAFKRTTDADTAWNIRQTTSPSYIVNEPTPAATYTVKVRALYNAVKSNESAASTHKINPLGVPTITDINSTVEKLNIAWNKADGAKSYDIAFRRTNIDAEGVWHHKTSTDTTLTVDNPTQGATYQVKVRAVRNNNYGEYSEISTNDIPVLGVPQNVDITSTIKWISINWNKADNATAYRIAIKRSTDQKWTYYTTTDTSYVYENPVKGATYYIQVQALCGTVKGNYTKYNTQVIPEKDPYEGLTYYEAGETVKVTHPAETELVWVVDEAAHDEIKTEVKSVYHYRICQCPDCGAVMDGWTAEQIREHDLVFHGIGIYWNGQTFLSYPDHLPYSKPKSGYVNEPVDTILHVSEKGHYEVKVIKEAWEEDVTIAQSGWYKTVTHPAETTQAKVIDKAAYYYEEPVYEYVYKQLCWGCDADVGVMDDKETLDHATMHHNKGEISGYRKVKLQIKTGTNTINVPEISHTETVVLNEAWTENVFVFEK